MASSQRPNKYSQPTAASELAVPSMRCAWAMAEGRRSTVSEDEKINGNLCRCWC